MPRARLERAVAIKAELDGSQPIDEVRALAGELQGLLLSLHGLPASIDEAYTLASLADFARGLFVGLYYVPKEPK